jgi:hypothetical protein
MKSLKNKLTQKIVAPLLIAGSLLTAPIPKLEAQDFTFEGLPEGSKTYISCKSGLYNPNSFEIKNYYGNFWRNSFGVTLNLPKNLRIEGSLGYAYKRVEGGGIQDNMNLFQIDGTANYVIPLDRVGAAFAYFGAGLNCSGAQERVFSIRSSVNRLSLLSSSSNIAFGPMFTTGFEFFMGEGSVLNGLVDRIYMEFAMRYAKMGKDNPDLGGISLDFGADIIP